MNQDFRFRNIRHGIETLKSSFSLPRHRHLEPYATVVVEGCLEEAGYNGRIRAGAGDVLIHPQLDCHANPGVFAGLRMVRLPWTDPEILSGIYHVDDVGEIVRAAEKDSTQAASLLSELLRQRIAASPHLRNDWPDLLAKDLHSGARMRIGEWARSHRLAPETVSRGFALAYGVSAEVFKAESRARRAWLRITTCGDELAMIAAETGFADQAHMTRWIQRITGESPQRWRHHRWKISKIHAPSRISTREA
ncbi:MAG TPA: AraC family transcriptional regulator [Acidobacteriaceae bacterium]|nr:AraC family transcriptional regulator [Acidobacteriaceae bacterium]